MTQTPTISAQSALMLLTLALVWAGSFIFAELALAELPPLTIVLFRVGLAVPVLALVVWARGLSLPRSLDVWGRYLVMGGLNNVIPFSLIFWGQIRIDAGLAAILNGTTAVFGAVVAGLLLQDERLTPAKLIGALFGLAGVVVILGPDLLSGFDISDLAQIAVLGAALSYALASVWGKVALAAQPPLVNALGMLIGSTVLMLPVVLLVGGVPSVALSVGGWAAVLALAVLSTALAYLLYFAILCRAGAANLMLVTLLIPPFATGIGVIYLGEVLTPAAGTGFALIAVGLLITDGRVFGKRAGV